MVQARQLASSSIRVGRMDEAIGMLEGLQPIHRKVFGPEHPDTLIAMVQLATCYASAGRMAEGMALNEELLPLMRRVKGPDHPDTLSAMRLLSGFYSSAGRNGEAVKLQEEVLATTRCLHGPAHSDTLSVMRELAALYHESGREVAAMELRNEVLALRQSGFPAVGAVLVAGDSEWKWLHPTDGKDPAESTPGFHTAFFRPDFDDSKWKTGTDSADPSGGLGYGLNFTGLSIGKPEAMAHRRTAYFRHAFKTDKLSAGLELRCRLDDGVIVYLDGKEVIRDNVEPGADAYLLGATKALGPDNDSEVHRFPIPGTLAAGEHLLVISIHNTAQPSSDLRLGGVTLVETKPAAIR